MSNTFDPDNYPLISEEEIEYALAFHGLPPYYRNPTVLTLRVHQVVTEIKAEIKLHHCPVILWEQLRAVLDVAAATGAFPETLDDLTKAWNFGNPDLNTLLLKGGDPKEALKDYHQVSKKFRHLSNTDLNPRRELLATKDRIYFLDLAAEKRLKRRYKTWMVVDSVKRLQFHLRRIPTRNEIMDDYALQDPEGQITADELTRQLTVLGWKKRILPEKFKKYYQKATGGETGF